MYGWCLRAEPLTHTDRCVAMPRSRCIQKSRCGRRLWMLAARQTRRSIIASHSHSTALTLWTVDDAAALHCFADTITHQSTFRSLSVVRYERMFFILSLEKNYSETYNAATFGGVVGAKKVESVKIISSEVLAQVVTLQWINPCPWQKFQFHSLI